MGLHRQRAHKRHHVQDENHISDKRIRHFLAQHHFKVSPQPLRHQPKCRAECHQPPEKPGASVRSAGVSEKANQYHYQKYTLDNIADGGEQITTGNENGQTCMKHHQGADQPPIFFPQQETSSHNCDSRPVSVVENVTEVIEPCPGSKRTRSSAMSAALC